MPNLEAASEMSFETLRTLSRQEDNLHRVPKINPDVNVNTNNNTRRRTPDLRLISSTSQYFHGILVLIRILILILIRILILTLITLTLTLLLLRAFILCLMQRLKLILMLIPRQMQTLLLILVLVSISLEAFHSSTSLVAAAGTPQREDSQTSWLQILPRGFGV